MIDAPALNLYERFSNIVKPVLFRVVHANLASLKQEPKPIRKTAK
ncbi:hypothetical protein J584_0615 [Acinetobacter sp. 72431]|nr:hypothetical protein J584_0615 [Acinetobacter sp. 72431]